jgi:hypothetical protein
MGGGCSHGVQHMCGAFISNWVARFDVPCAVTTNRGTQFTSLSWTSMCTGLGIQHILTTAYHMQTNGKVERVHRQIKNALHAHAGGPLWPSHIPRVPHGYSWAYVQPPKKTPGPLLWNWCWGLLYSCLEKCCTCLRSHVSTGHLLLPGQHYTWRLPTRRCPIWWEQRMCLREASSGPVSRPLPGDGERGFKVFKVQIGQNVESMSVNHLRPHTGSSPLRPVTAAPRGLRNRRLLLLPSLHPEATDWGGGGNVWRIGICL